MGSPEAWRKAVTEAGLEILQFEADVTERTFDGELGGGNETQVCIVARKPEAAGEDSAPFNPLHGPFPLVSREHVGPEVDHAGCKAIYAHMDINRILNDVSVALKEKNVTSVGYIGLDLFNIDKENNWNDNITAFDLNSESNLPSDPTALLFFWALHRRHLLTHFDELSKKLGKHLSQVKTVITVQAAPDSEGFHLLNDAMHGLPFHPYHHGYVLHFMEKRFKEMGFVKVKYVTSEAVFRFGEKEGVTDLEEKIQIAVTLLAGTMKQPDAQDEEGLKNINAFKKNLEGLTRALFSHSNGVVRNQAVLLIADKEA
ncbi:hypothetical protein Clacol_008484 [Clathrus columnatus]|uniref:ATP-grasp domain-containing protein n=1 Tax=Clathrus columnatus TaxID=1419009 RepID=A0AAV5AHW3_9AGAM|nr:hypothetical protein Clacol_008484 [Clathrus columnatus]